MVESVEMLVSHHPRADEMDAYERVLGDAMAGDATIFAREDYVEEAWRIVDPVLKSNTPVSANMSRKPGDRPRWTRGYCLQAAGTIPLGRRHLLSRASSRLHERRRGDQRLIRWWWRYG